MQTRGASQPDGIVYNTAMRSPDAALALAGLYGFASKREAKVGAVCVAGAGFSTAVFCDIVARFYTGAAKNGNESLAVGLAAVIPLAPDSAMVQAVVDRKQDNGQPFYNRSIVRMGDTAQAEALLRNGVIFNATSVLVLSAPATWLAQAMMLNGAKDIFRQRVKRLVIVDSAATASDPPALQKVAAEWPGPVFFCGRDVGEALPFPGVRLDSLFSGAAAHPVADAYRAFQPMPYEAPCQDLAALYFAVHPEVNFFQASEPGAVATARATPGIQFSPGKGNVKRITVDPERRDAAIAALTAIATTATGSGAPRGGG